MTKLLKNVVILSALLGAATPLRGADNTEISAAISAAKDAPRNQAANLKAADLLKDAGRFQEAIPFYLKGGNSGNLGIAESYFYLYDFDKADEYLDKYLAKRTKNEAAKDMGFSYGNGDETLDWTDYLRSRIDLGRSMLDRVEKIQIVDSINVPADQFFKFIKLAKSAGRLADEFEIESIVPKEYLDSESISGLWAPAYISESGEDMIWYGSANDGESKMFESYRLADGSWDNPAALFDYKSIFSNSNGSWVGYPFLMADGITLYFAADGENSLGDLDIFISRRDEDGFLQPSNIGMPYNSPYNDYMYAIDEQTGAGWWATDRNGLKDSVTIYTFIPQDLRINYPVDTPNLADYAKVTSIGMTQNPDRDYSKFRDKIASLELSKTSGSNRRFEFALPNGKIITSVSDLASGMAREAMRQYLDEQKAYDDAVAHLAELRKAYAAGDRSVEHEILTLENGLDHRRAELKRIKNSIITAVMD